MKLYSTYDRYRSLLNTWSLFLERCKFDIYCTNSHEDTQNTGPNLHCNRCNKSYAMQANEVDRRMRSEFRNVNYITLEVYTFDTNLTLG